MEMSSHGKAGRRNFMEQEYLSQSIETRRADLGSRREVSVAGEAGKQACSDPEGLRCLHFPWKAPMYS